MRAGWVFAFNGLRPPLKQAADDNAKGNMESTETGLPAGHPAAADVANPMAASDAPLGMREMMEAGVHFGHQTKRWNPKMKTLHLRRAQRHPHHRPAALGPRLQARLQLLRANVAAGKPVLFVGTKKQAQDVVREEAVRGGQFYVTNRWLGGTLTNFHRSRARSIVCRPSRRCPPTEPSSA